MEFIKTEKGGFLREDYTTCFAIFVIRAGKCTYTGLYT